MNEELQEVSSNIFIQNFDSKDDDSMRSEETGMVSLEDKPEALITSTLNFADMRNEQAMDKISLEVVDQNSLILNHNNYYDSLNSDSIIVYNLASETVNFDSLESANIEVDSHGCTPYISSTANFLEKSPPIDELYINDEAFVNESEGNRGKFLINGTDDVSFDSESIFLESKSPPSKNMTDNLSDNINFNLAAVNFEHTTSANSENLELQYSSANLNSFIYPFYSSAAVDSEVALTLASLGDLKILDSKLDSSCKKRKSSKKRRTKSSGPKKVDNSSTLRKVVRAGQQNDEDNLIFETISPDVTENAVNSSKSTPGESSKTLLKGVGRDKERENKVISKEILEGTKGKKFSQSPTDACKENLLGQLLKASEHCEPSSLIPESVVDGVIPAVGYRIMDMANLTEIIQIMHNCSKSISSESAKTSSIVIQERASLRQGAASQLSVICTGCRAGAVCATSSKSEEIDSECSSFDINARVSRLTREFNVDEAQLKRMLEILGVFYRSCKNEDNPLIPSEDACTDRGKNESHSKESGKSSSSLLLQNTDHDETKRIECKLCSKKFTAERYLTIHMSSHNMKRHSCPYCQAYFSRGFNLKEHIRKHENKRYTCDKCNKSYSDRSTLASHVKKIHLQMYKLECPVCTKKFFHKSHFNEHMRIHSGVKPYSCNSCGKCFSHISGINKHKQSHCESSKYKCGLCGKWFKWLWDIKHHLRQQHKLKKGEIEAQVDEMEQKETLRDAENDATRQTTFKDGVTPHYESSSFVENSFILEQMR